MTNGRAFVGTSGWSYTTWRPVFYPQELKTKDFLRYYGTRLATLEINYTFNHLPTEKNIATWREATPPEFLFALKASRQITHYRQLQDPAETLPLFFERGIIEIRPRRAFLWEDGDTTQPPQVFELVEAQS